MSSGDAIQLWTQAEIKAMNRKTRKLLTLHGLLPLRSLTDRQGIGPKTNLEAIHEISTQGLVHYLELKWQDKYLGMVYGRNTINKKGNTLAGTDSKTYITF